MRKTLGELKRRIRAFVDWDDHQVVSYSQEGEDLILERIFSEQRLGTYVDVGAHHPRRFSNTWWAYERGWSGIVIDASEKALTGFRSRRPRDISVHAAVVEDAGEVTLHVFEEAALNTVSASRASYVETATKQNHRRESVPGMPLSEILLRYMPGAKSQIDLLSIDVEGAELSVLRSNDWERFRPRVIVVELLGSCMQDSLNSEAGVLLRGLNYEPVSFLYHSAIFVGDAKLLEENWGS